ncbi:hypothetical protein Nepgr_031163 [Nepenthes gracilis]|uniref:S-protein homolog n=1 Tax=Nepenthes gracilis TaxID=150966 RepID=A0AAD3TGV1_NEPGR|nr:hypothetical protein Nepgr_031163 [Nepenthes gracilis]
MGNATLYGFLLVVTVVLCLKTQPTWARSHPLDFWNLKIRDSFRETARIQCRPAENDLGVHYLRLGHWYSFSFRQHLWEKTLSWCRFHDSKRIMAFDVFFADYDYKSYEKCHEHLDYDIREDGFNNRCGRCWPIHLDLACNWFKRHTWTKTL